MGVFYILPPLPHPRIPHSQIHTLIVRTVVIRQRPRQRQLTTTPAATAIAMCTVHNKICPNQIPIIIRTFPVREHSVRNKVLTMAVRRHRRHRRPA